ncbi:MAG: ATP-binding protein [Bacilli bacterium]|nr:ATP-binding protein [Bacilli bacterium]
MNTNLKNIVVNREKEIEELERRYNSDRPEFVAVYGRRRVGKTFLIDSVFNGRFTFKHAGLSPISGNQKKMEGKMKEQLKHFYNSLLIHGMKPSKYPTSWLEAFYMLELFLEERENDNKLVIFIDEIQWMDTPKSDFMSGLEAFWNNWVCYSHNVLLIVCGSSTSWILDKLINNYGGLYNRLTCQIKLEQFNLAECEKFLNYNNVNMSRYDIATTYMVLGGIPYYLEKINREKSLGQNIDDLFFNKGAVLENEFERLFSSIFTNASTIIKVVKAINSKRIGLSRSEIIDYTGIESSGELSSILKALENGDFIIKYKPFGGSKNMLYKLIDPFCLFYLSFVDNKSIASTNFWMNNIDSQRTVVWKGLAYENVCFNHINQIKKSLEILGVSSNNYMWSKKGDIDSEGTQIDLIIDRKDNVVNMCEIKFYQDDFLIDKDYHLNIVRKARVLKENIGKKRTSIIPILITTFGIKNNEYRFDFNKVITLDDLFKEV